MLIQSKQGSRGCVWEWETVNILEGNVLETLHHETEKEMKV
jgi:hypothetical protein